MADEVHYNQLKVNGILLNHTIMYHLNELNFSMIIRIFTLLLMSGIGVFSHAQNKLHAKSSVDILKEAWKHKENDEVKKAEAAFSSISINDTNYVLAQKELALLYMSTNRYEQSNEILHDLLKYESAYKDRASVYYILAQSYNGLEQYEKSHEVLDQGIKEYPMNHILYHVKGLTYEIQEDYQNALEAYKNAVQIDMNYHNSHMRLGVLAAHEGKYTQAMFSLIACLMVEPDGSNSRGIVALLEEIADGTFTPSSKGITLSEDGDKFDQINLLFSNKIALQSKYKVKFTISTAYARQLHLILSNVEYNKNDEGFWHQQYLAFYKDVYNAGLLDAMILFTLQSVTIPKTAKTVASKKSVIDKFLKEASVYWSKNNMNQFLEFEGEKQAVTVIQQNTGPIVGKFNSNEKPVGNWYYYYTQGNLSLKAELNDKGEKHGTFRYYDAFTNNLIEEKEYENNVQTGKQKKYYRSGELEQVLTYREDQVVDTVYNYYRGGQIEDIIPLKDGKRHGVAIGYYENGQVKYQTNFSEGEASGEYRSYHPNGVLEMEVTLEKGKANGTKKGYYPDGQPEYEYPLKNDMVEGDYKKYHANGKVEETGKMTAGKIFGENISYYSNGTIYSKGQYDEGGKENGAVEYYDSEGRKYLTIDFKKGSIQKIELFSTDGKSIKSSSRSGKKISYENYYPTRHLYCEGDIVDDKRSGVWKYYDNYGVLEKTEKYVNGILQDSVITYHPDGKIESVSEFKNDERDGVYLKYNIFGKLIQEGRYSNGKAVNDWYEYHPDGSLMEEYAFNMDVRHGYFKNYGVNGKLENYNIYSEGIIVATVHLDTNEVETQRFGQYNGEIKLKDPLNNYDRFVGNYNSGYINGEVKWYDVENNLITTGAFVNGKREGLWIWYNSKGDVWKKIDYKNGKIHGEYIEYHENGKVRTTQKYQYGNSQGPTVFYFSNGNKESESDYIDDLRHGRFITYGYDGSIQQIRNYDRGVLISYTYLDKNGKELPPVNVEKGESSFTVYYQNGVKAVEQTRVNGALHGTYKEYYPDGTPMIHSNYYYGELEGPYVRYHPNGNKSLELTYRYNEIEGTRNEYYSNGTLKESGTYHLGERSGERKLYSEKGELIKTYIYYNDQMVEVR